MVILYFLLSSDFKYMSLLTLMSLAGINLFCNLTLLILPSILTFSHYTQRIGIEGGALIFVTGVVERIPYCCTATGYCLHAC